MCTFRIRKLQKSLQKDKQINSKITFVKPSIL